MKLAFPGLFAVTHSLGAIEFFGWVSQTKLTSHQNHWIWKRFLSSWSSCNEWIVHWVEGTRTVLPGWPATQYAAEDEGLNSWYLWILTRCVRHQEVYGVTVPHLLFCSAFTGTSRTDQLTCGRTNSQCTQVTRCEPLTLVPLHLPPERNYSAESCIINIAVRKGSTCISNSVSVRGFCR